MINKKCINLIIIIGLLVIGCENDINDEIDIRLNGNWIAYVKTVMNIPINQLPPHIIELINQSPDTNEFPGFYVDRETGMVQIEVEYKMEYIFNNGKYEYINSSKGTYVTNNGKIIMKMTHIYYGTLLTDTNTVIANLDWYTRDELKAIPKSSSVSGDEEYFSEEEINNLFSEKTISYSIKNNILIFYYIGGEIKFERNKN